MDLLIATTNRGKVIEIRHALEGFGLRILSLSDLPPAPPVIEDAETFEGNARKKARHYAQWSGKAVLADDSGLVVEALAGRPGVHSARYAIMNEGGFPSEMNGEVTNARWGVRGGEQYLPPLPTDEDNRQKLLREMTGIPEGKRGAAFVCCLVLVTPEGREIVIEGRVGGLIATASRGQNGFGYDPLFLIPSLGKTTAELSLDEKNKVSHRGKALARMRVELQNLFFHGQP